MFDKLKDKQLEMRNRLDNQDDLEEERKEIEEICSRTDLICPYCRTNPSKASKRNGIILPCQKCANKRTQLYKYGLTLHSYAKMLAEQKHRCAICGKDIETVKDKVNSHIDHCHELGHTRGILCPSCNAGIGNFKDDEGLLKNAIKYLIYNRLGRKWWISKEL